MERLFAAVFLSLLLAMSVAVHHSLALDRPVLPPDGMGGGGRLAMIIEPPAAPSGTDPSVETPARVHETSSMSSSAPSSALVLGTVSGVPAADLVESRGGFWLSAPSEGRFSRIDRGPTPRQSGLVPILMYHHVQPIDFRLADAFSSSLTLPPTAFEQQLRYLKERRITSISMSDLVLYLQGRKDLPGRSVVLTFDDGYRDNYQYAYPLLLRYGIAGTFYVITDLVERGDYMSWWQLRDMVASGMEIGSHTLSHPDLARVAASQREKELSESKRALETALGVAITALSYPSGSYSPEVVPAARRAGYTSAVTTVYGAVQDYRKTMELPRVRVQGTDTVETFKWRIEQYFPSADPVTR